MERFEERESVVLQHNGEKMFGVLHVPHTKTPVPCVFVCHGLAGHKVGHNRLYVTLSERLSKLGVATFRMDFRGNGDSEGEFAEMTIQSEIEDAMIGIDFLQKHKKIDNSRMGIMGRSFGGAIAVLTAGRFEKFKSIALWSSVYNAYQWEEKWEMAEAGQIGMEERHELMRINGQLPSMAFYEQLFSMDLKPELDKLLDIPMLHIHGEKDPIVSVDHAVLYERERMKAHAESVFIRLPHSDHDYTHPEEKDKAINTTCEWFRNTL